MASDLGESVALSEGGHPALTATTATTVAMAVAATTTTATTVAMAVAATTTTATTRDSAGTTSTALIMTTEGTPCLTTTTETTVTSEAPPTAAITSATAVPERAVPPCAPCPPVPPPPAPLASSLSSGAPTTRRPRRISWKEEDLTIPDRPIKGECDGGVGRRTSGGGGVDDPLLLGGRDLDDPHLDEFIDLPAELPPPPDGGWGWVIVIVSFLANMVVDGVAYSFSPFLPIFSTYFDSPQGTVAWVSSLLAGVYLSAGPVVSALSNRYGCRVVCMVGSVISCLAFVSTIWANSVGYLMITQGLIAGFGFGLIYLPAVVCVGYYFEKKRALATGIAVCGSGVGTMVFPPLVKYLIQEYTWKGANLLLAGIIINCLWCGALMRPLEVPRMTKRDLLVRLEEEERQLRESLAQGLEAVEADGLPQSRKRSSTSNGDPGVNSHLNLNAGVNSGAMLSGAGLPTIQEGKTEERNGGGDAKETLLSSFPEGGPAAKVSIVSVGQFPRNTSQPAMVGGTPRRVLPTVGSVPNFSRRRSRTELVNHLKVIPATPRASSFNLQERRGSGSSHHPPPPPAGGSGLRQRRPSNERRGMMLRPMSRQDIFYSGSIHSLHEYKSQLSMLSYRESTLNLQGTGASRAVLQVLEGTEDAADAIDDGVKEEKGLCDCLPESMRGILSQMLDLSLIKDPVFLLIGVANIFGMLGFYTPYVYLPGAAIEKGIDPESATFLISIIGITNTMGRVLSGLIADLESVNSLYVNNICIVCSGLCVFFTPFASSYASFITLSVFFGFFVSPFIALTSIILVDLLGLARLSAAFGLLCIFRGVAAIMSSPLAAGYISLTSIILVELLGLEQLTTAFGLLILFRGASSMVGPPLAGSIYDSTKSYDVSFYCAGVLLFCCAALYALVPLARRHCAAHRPPVHYMTNEEYLQGFMADGKSEEQQELGEGPAGEGAGITINIGPKGGGLQRINEVERE